MVKTFLLIIVLTNPQQQTTNKYSVEFVSYKSCLSAKEYLEEPLKTELPDHAITMYCEVNTK